MTKRATRGASVAQPKSGHFTDRRAARLDEQCAGLVDTVWVALAKQRGFNPEELRAKHADLGRRRAPSGEPTFSEAHRILLLRSFKAVQALAGKPEAWPASGEVELPTGFWDLLAECKNRVAHSQGSLYNVSKKLNFDDAVTKAETRQAFEDVAESKAILERLEAMAVAFLKGDSEAA